MSLRNVISMQIQTIDYCNRKCSWCPNSKIEKNPNNLMSLDLIDRILSELSINKYKGRINLYLMAEPLCDSRLVDIVKVVRSWFSSNEIGLSTNGDLFDYDLASKLIGAGVSQIRVNHYDENSHVQTNDNLFPQIIHRSLKEIAPTFYNRGGNILPNASNKHEFCSFVCSKLYINWKGDVILCCSDYKYEVVFGNIMEQSLEDIYNCSKYKMYREYHSMGRERELKLCSKCTWI